MIKAMDLDEYKEKRINMAYLNMQMCKAVHRNQQRKAL